MSKNRRKSGKGKRLVVVTGVGVSLLLLACLIPLRDDISWWYKKWHLLRESQEWKEYRGHLYRLTQTTGNWLDGEEYAEEIGGHLLAISDAEEQKWVIDTFGTEAVWIGSTDKDSEGDWRWTSGEQFRFTNWHSGEPNNATASGEDFGVLNHFNKRGLWNDLGPAAESLRGVVELSGP